MEAKLTVPEYATQKGVNQSTVYRWIRQGKIDTGKVDGVLHVIVDSQDIALQDANPQEMVIEQMRSEIEYLRKENEHLCEELSKSRQRSDTIILQLTRQVEQKTLALEDMRDRSLWRRIKMAVIRAGAPPATEQRGV